MNIESLLTSLAPFSLIIVFFILIVYALRSKNDGKNLIKTFIEKKTLMLEIVLLFIAVVEATVAAQLGQKEGMAYASRLGMHMSLALASATVGFGIFKQMTEFFDAIRQKAPAYIIAKEGVEWLFSIMITLIAPVVNTYYIVLSLHAQQQVFAAFNGDFLSLSNPTAFVSTAVCFVHICGVFYLGLLTYEIKLVVTPIVTTVPNTKAVIPIHHGSEDDEDAELDSVGRHDPFSKNGRQTKS